MTNVNLFYDYRRATRSRNSQANWSPYTQMFFITFLLCLSLIIFFSPIITLAAEDFTPSDETGIIPCGGKTNHPCTFADFYKLAKNIIAFSIKYLAIPLATLSIAISGWYFIVSGEKEERRSKAKDILWGTIIGLTLALAAWLIVDAILDGLIRQSVRDKLPIEAR